MATQDFCDDIGQFLLACIYPFLRLVWTIAMNLSVTGVPLNIDCARDEVHHAPTCGIVDERTVDVQLDLAFFTMFWEVMPVCVGDVRARLVCYAEHEWPYIHLSC